MKLSILIPTVVERKEQCKRLCSYLAFLAKPYPGLIDIQTAVDNKEMSIGLKRNFLYSIAKGEYSLQVDDDDMLSLSSLDQIMSAITDNSPDCVCYYERCIMNGTLYKCDHSIKYDAWENNKYGFDFVRHPYFKDVIKTDIAKSVKAPDSRYGEDHQFSIDIKPFLKTEHHIDNYIYYYEHESSDFKTRYGFDKQ